MRPVFRATVWARVCFDDSQREPVGAGISGNDARTGLGWVKFQLVEVVATIAVIDTGGDINPCGKDQSPLFARHCQSSASDCKGSPGRAGPSLNRNRWQALAIAGSQMCRLASPDRRVHMWGAG